MCSASVLQRFLACRNVTRMQAVRLNAWYTHTQQFCKGDAQREALLAGVCDGLNDSNGDAYPHVHGWLSGFVRGQRMAAPHPGQEGCVDVIPTLTARPVWDAASIGVSQDVAAGLTARAVDLLGALKRVGTEDPAAYDAPEAFFQPYRNPAETCSRDTSLDEDIDGSSAAADRNYTDSLGDAATTAGHWNVGYIELHGAAWAGAPRSTGALGDALVAEVARLPQRFEHCLLSCLSPGAVIRPHRGPTNKKLRFYLPLVVPEGGLDVCGLKVHGDSLALTPGTPIVFDDSFVHSAWNRSHASRFVLIADVWHPDLQPAEVALLSAMQAAFEASMQHPSTQSATNPYTTMVNARAHGTVDAAQLWTGL